MQKGWVNTIAIFSEASDILTVYPKRNKKLSPPQISDLVWRWTAFGEAPVLEILGEVSIPSFTLLPRPLSSCWGPMSQIDLFKNYLHSIGPWAKKQTEKQNKKKRLLKINYIRNVNMHGIP